MWSVLFSTTSFAELFKVTITGGVSSPAPGATLGAQISGNAWKRGIVGGAYDFTHNELARDGTLKTHQVGAFIEQGWPFIDSYHLFWTQAGVGVARVDRNLTFYPEENIQGKWAAAFHGGLGVELPVADLVGVRMGLRGHRLSHFESKVIVSSVLGIRFGAEWLGLGR